MSEQLDWLARNVHEWPDGQTHVQLSRDVYFYAVRPVGGVSYSKQQWLDRRAELQNKPSWTDAPGWAKWLAQDSDGGWWFYRGEPTAATYVWREVNRHYANDGDVLGDWRDTLERRPASTGVSASGAAAGFAAIGDAFNGKCVAQTASLHTIHHAAFLHQGCQLLLSEPELVVFRTADGELIHCKPKECLIDPDVYGLAARLLADMSGHPIAPEHMRELAEQIGWPV